MSKSNPFEFVKSITYAKNYLPDEYPTQKHFESDYNAFIINRGLSYYNDTIIFANELNKYPNLPAQCQYDFYFHYVPKKKRFSKWAKVSNTSKLEVIIEYYKCNRSRALEYEKLLTDDQIFELQERLVKGG